MQGRATRTSILSAMSTEKPHVRPMFHPMRRLIPLLTLSVVLSVAHGGLYRWVDEGGNVHYTDTLPPDQVQQGHTELSEGGVRIKTVPRAKTEEEIKNEKELERLRTQQERLVEQQKAADRVLLQTFRSEDDMLMARDGQVATIDVMIQVTRNDVRRQQQWLAGQRTEAANLERTGKPVPQNLSDGIASTERSIRDAYATIIEREAQKEAIRTSFDHDLARFRQLHDLPPSPAGSDAQETRPVIQNIVTCSGRVQCNLLWQDAITYVREHATTQVQANSDILLITAPPTGEQDVSLILSRINDKSGDGATLFLDVQCKSSQRGQETCRGSQARGIVEGFRPAMTGEGRPQP